MSFTQPAFAYLLAALLPLWWLARRHYPARVAVLIVASLVFYGYNQWWLLGLIGAYCVVDWAVALWIERAAHPGRALALGVGFNLAVLAYWKYTPLLLATFAAALGQSWSAPEGWVIPMGISFFAFTGIAYMVDVYRRVLPAERNLATFVLFKTFFPQLVAGPILRGREFLPQLQPGTLPSAPLAPLEGTLLIGRGLFKKMVLADAIAVAIDPYFAHVGTPATAGVWALPYVYLYAAQIYCDFSGYTDIARGLGLWFGFRWPENFALPYLASSIQEFWRRWHITLSRFLRDYLYIPLGGNRMGRTREIAALMTTMLLGGLWHGAAWSFVLWGGMHGLMLVLNRAWQRTVLGRRMAALDGWAGRAWHLGAIALTFHLVCLGWCFFRLTDLAAALVCVRGWVMFDLDKLLVGEITQPALWLPLLAYMAAWAIAAIATRNAPLGAVVARLGRASFAGGAAWGTASALVVLAIALAPAGRAPPFIYFRF